MGHAAEFKRFTRIDLHLLEEIHYAIARRIHRQDTNYRECVTTGERLAITLRFLATGDCYPSLQALFRVSVSTICKLIPETCQALVETYTDELLVIPNTERGWKEVADRLAVRWNFHHTIGAVDGKHIRIKKHAKSKTEYRNPRATIQLSKTEYRNPRATIQLSKTEYRNPRATIQLSCWQFVMRTTILCTWKLEHQANVETLVSCATVN